MLAPTKHGVTSLALPYVQDHWRNAESRARISVQLLLLSGTDFYKKVFTRISTDQKWLIVTFPMSPYLARADFAFPTFVIDEMDVQPHERCAMLVVLKHHSKSAARMVSVAKIKGHSNTDGFFYEQRIPLSRPCKHNFAACTDGDQFFFGKKFIKYPDGSVHLHVELLCDTKDDFHPEEVRQDIIARSASAVLNNVEIDTTMANGNLGGATVLQNAYNASQVRMRSFKRRACVTDVEPQLKSPPMQTSEPAAPLMEPVSPAVANLPAAHQQEEDSQESEIFDEYTVDSNFQCLNRAQTTPFKLHRVCRRLLVKAILNLARLTILVV